MSAQPAADSAEITLLPIPDPRPPLLDARAVEARLAQSDQRVHYVQAAMRIQFTGSAADHDEDPLFCPQPTATAMLPDPDAWARTMITAIFEVMDGRRPIAQIQRALAPEIRDRIARRSSLARRRGTRQSHAPTIRALSCCTPADGVAEVSSVVQHADLVRAMAVRLTGVDGRWVVSAFELG